MSLYDWLLFLHVLTAFVLVAALVVFWIIGIVARNVAGELKTRRQGDDCLEGDETCG